MSRRHDLVDRGRHDVSDDLRTRLLAGTPVTERRVRLAGVSTALWEGGDGPPMVLLHGGIESGGVYWAPVIARLAEHSRVLVPDVPGLGASEPFPRLDHAAFAAWLTELLQLTEPGPEQPVILAHSLIGSLAARFAASHGDLLSRLVILGAPGIGPYHLPLGLAVTAIRFDLRPSERNNARFARWAFLDPERTRRLDPEWFDAFMGYGLSRATVPHVKRTMRRLIKVGTQQVPDAELRQIAVPTTLLWGRHDRMVRLRVAEWAHARFGWPLEVVDDVGHVPFVEAPVAFLGALRSVLEPGLGG